MKVLPQCSGVPLDVLTERHEVRGVFDAHRLASLNGQSAHRGGLEVGHLHLDPCLVQRLTEVLYDQLKRVRVSIIIPDQASDGWWSILSHQAMDGQTR